MKKTERFERGRRLVDALAHAQMLRWSCLAAVALVALNDHVFKGEPSYPRALANKTSDFAGLYFFPFLCYDFVVIALAAVQPCASTHGERPRLFAGLLPRLFAGLLVVTGLVFLGAKIPGWTHAFVVEVARAVSPFPVHAVADPSDVVALGVLPVAWWVYRRVPLPAEAPPE